MNLILQQDRRERRSSNSATALRYQLESTLRQGKMAALALTDEAGTLVAFAGDEAVCTELGALAPVVAHGWPADFAPVPVQIANSNAPPRTITKEDVSVRAIEAFGESLFLASLGGGVARDALLAHSARGVHRILTAN
jgi:hypothetical protein